MQAVAVVDSQQNMHGSVESSFPFLFLFTLEAGLLTAACRFLDLLTPSVANFPGWAFLALFCGTALSAMNLKCSVPVKLYGAFFLGFWFRFVRRGITT